MKQCIRSNTFETNSSSMHSLVISKESQLYTKDDLNLRYDAEYSLKYENGMFYLSTSEDDMKFGRSPFSVLKDPGLSCYKRCLSKQKGSYMTWIKES